MRRIIHCFIASAIFALRLPFSVMKTKSKFYMALYLALIGIAPLCQSADGKLTPATIKGEIGFTNTGSTATILNDEGMTGCLIQGNSASPAGFTAHTNCTRGIVSPIPGKNYSLTVESDGDVLPPGVTYELSGRANLYAGSSTSSSGRYNFLNQTGIHVIPNALVPVDFKECAGIIDFKIGKNNCTTPVTVERLRLNTLFPGRFADKNVNIPVSQTYFAVPDMGGKTHPIRYTLQSGTDSFSDQIQVQGQIDVTPQCNIVTELPDKCIDADALVDPRNLGEIVGLWDIVGEQEVKLDNRLTRVYGFHGPALNFRLASIPGINFSTPSSSPPNDPWELENLPPGAYRVGGQSVLRTGRASVWFAPQSLGEQGLPPVAVSAGGINDLGNTFVITPGFIFGDIVLKDPFTVTSGLDNGAYSGLRYLVRVYK